MDPRYVWIMHNNCRRSCSHCFCNPLPENDADKTKELAQELNRHGLDVRIYASDQMDNHLEGNLGQSLSLLLCSALPVPS